MTPRFCRAVKPLLVVLDRGWYPVGRSLRATRQMLLSLNEGCEGSPVVPFARIGVFRAQSFAAISQRDVLSGTEHQFGYQSLTMSPKRAAEARLETFVAASRVPHAPATGLGFNAPNWGRFWGLPDRLALDACFHWMKAVDRGIGIFLQQQIEGKKPDLAELQETRALILSRYPHDRRKSPLLERIGSKVRDRVAWRLTAKWDQEQGRGVGPLTRLLLGLAAYEATAQLRPAARAVASGEYDGLGDLGARESREQKETRLRLAEDLIQQSRQPRHKDLPDRQR